MELLIRVVDRCEPGQTPRPDQSQAGDVIAACPDGWPWSDAERDSPEWRIVRLPLTQTEADALTATEVVTPSTPKDTILNRRVYKLDLAKWAPPIVAALDDPAIATTIVDVSADLANIRATVVQKAAGKVTIQPSDPPPVDPVDPVVP